MSCARSTLILSSHRCLISSRNILQQQQLPVAMRATCRTHHNKGPFCKPLPSTPNPQTGHRNEAAHEACGCHGNHIRARRIDLGLQPNRTHAQQSNAISSKRRSLSVRTGHVGAAVKLHTARTESSSRPRPLPPNHYVQRIHDHLPVSFDAI
jgi:hypothetical protein